MATKSARESTEEGTEPKRRKIGADSVQSLVTEQELATVSGGHLREEDVAIVEWVNRQSRFSGIIKQRYSDFLVNEIAPDGRVIHLTSLAVPDEPEREEAKSLLEEESFLSEEIEQQLEETSRGERESTTIKTSNDKLKRGRIHEAIKAKFPQLESSTKDDGEEKVIYVVRATKSNKSRRNPWPKSRGGDYCRFVLYKEYKDTADAISLMAKFINAKPTLFAFAGSKDKRAVTVQAASAYRVSAETLAKLNEKLRNIRVGNFSYSNSPLRLGELEGNRFQIILRNVKEDTSVVDSCLASLQDKGFINYYGMQRFGTSSVPTYEVGKALLSSRWQDAIGLILTPLRKDEPDVAKVCSLWSDTGNASKCLKQMPKRCTIEIQLLKGIQRFGMKDAWNCLNAIPRSTRLMYVHSYQSLIWNRLVSRRLQQFQFNVLPGDLVQHKESSSVKEISEEELPCYTIFDVVVPLPGHDVKLPQNQMEEWYNSMLKEDGFTLAGLKHRVKDYSLSGAYRKLLVKPTDVDWSHLTYDDVTVSLIETDLQKLEGSFAHRPSEGQLKAVRVNFSLPSSSYATMALRELTKTDTSSAFQTTLNATA
ncbi:pseudouridylate synthase 7 homolog [Oscarella lobularis]|uniref:pseudouridylate synthase 7 homolog n=1 Tax=Oscarella lobularis TaxID=121494 RepID=UPI0033137541